MVKDSSLYNTLGISPNANENEIKKAYKKMAIKWHPDKNKDEPEKATKEFQKISEAFSILSDKDKRSAYDKFGMDGVNDNGGPNINPEDIFSQFFGGGSPFGGNPFQGSPFESHFNFGGGPQQEKREDINLTVKVDLKSIYNEKVIDITFDQKINCDKCDGTGNKNKISPKCPDCDGRGKVMRVMQIGPMITQQVQPCQSCRGTGKKKIDSSDICKQCDGKSYNIVKKTIKLPLKNGLEENHSIQMKGEGHRFKDHKTDLIINVKITEDNLFKRVDNNLITTVTLELYQGLFGFDKLITLMDDRIIHISSKTQTIDGSLKVIKGKGMKNLSNGITGDLIIKFKVKYPDLNNYSKEELNTVKNILSKNNKKELLLENNILNNKEFSSKFKKFELEEISDKQKYNKNTSNQRSNNNSEVPECVHQ